MVVRCGVTAALILVWLTSSLCELYVLRLRSLTPSLGFRHSLKTWNEVKLYVDPVWSLNPSQPVYYRIIIDQSNFRIKYLVVSIWVWKMHYLEKGPDDLDWRVPLGNWMGNFPKEDVSRLGLVFKFSWLLILSQRPITGLPTRGLAHLSYGTGLVFSSVTLQYLAHFLCC